MGDLPPPAGLIDAMCKTWRHDFGLPAVPNPPWLPIGITEFQRESLRASMCQLWEHDIAPVVRAAADGARREAAGSMETAFRAGFSYSKDGIWTVDEAWDCSETKLRAATLLPTPPQPDPVSAAREAKHACHDCGCKIPVEFDLCGNCQMGRDEGEPT